MCIVLVAGALAPVARGISYAQGGCGDAPPPRLVPGGRASVLFTDGSPLNVRDTSSLSGVPVTQIPEGGEFSVNSGPVCADNIYWWAITVGGVNGWIAEGVAGDYFVGPLDTPAVTPGAPLRVVPFVSPTIP